MIPTSRHTPIVVLLFILLFGLLLFLGPIMDIIDIAHFLGFGGMVEDVIDRYRGHLILLIVLMITDWTRFVLQNRSTSHTSIYKLIESFVQNRDALAVMLIFAYLFTGGYILLSAWAPSIPPIPPGATDTLTPTSTGTPTHTPTLTSTPTRTPTITPSPTADPAEDPCTYYGIRLTSHRADQRVSTGERINITGRFIKEPPSGRLHLLIRESITDPEGQNVYWAEDATIDLTNGTWDGSVYIDHQYRGANADISIVLAWFDDEMKRWIRREGIVFGGEDNASKLNVDIRNRDGVFICNEVPIRVR